jgi:hypothetical protein
MGVAEVSVKGLLNNVNKYHKGCWGGALEVKARYCKTA